jgi:hypothetical protein
MASWRSTLKAAPIPWLLEPDNPSVCYLTLRHLLDRPEDDPEVQEARTAIPRSRLVERIFAHQTPGGFWGDPATPYQPKYKATLLDADGAGIPEPEPRGRAGAASRGVHRWPGSCTLSCTAPTSRGVTSTTCCGFLAIRTGLRRT